MKWFKFYGQDWLTDIKIINMPIEDRLCFITLLCLAASSEIKGYIQNCDEETIIRMTYLYEDPYDDNNEVSRARGFLKRLNDNKMITIDNVGAFQSVTVVNFNKRQGQNLTGYERVKKFRNKEKVAKNIDKKGIENVINDNVNDNVNDNARIEKNRKEKSIVGEQSSPPIKELKRIISEYIDVSDIDNKTNGSYMVRLYNSCEKDISKVEDLCKAVKVYSDSDYPYSIYSVRSLYEKKNKIESRLKGDNKKKSLTTKSLTKEEKDKIAKEYGIK